MDLLGRSALVTGSTGDGMGRSIALTLAREGADVALNWGTARKHNRKAAMRIADEIRRSGRRCLLCPGDTREAATVTGIVRKVERAFGRLDLLVINSGGDWVVRDYDKVPPAAFRSVVRAELDAAFFLLQAAVPGMRKRSFGRIVQVSMVVPDNWKGLAPDYTIGKAARTALMRGLYRRELKHGITFNTVSPGPVEGVPLSAALELRDHGPAWRARRVVTPQDAAEIVRFLCSDAARHVSGTEVIVPSWAFAG